MILIGARAHEKKQKQPIIIDATIELDIQNAVAKDHISTTIDYSKVVQAIIAFVENKQFELLESLSHHLAQEILTKFPIKNISLMVHKPQATQGLANISFEYSSSNCH